MVAAVMKWVIASMWIVQTTGSPSRFLQDAGGDAGAPSDGTSMSVSDPSQSDPSLPEGQNVEKKGTNDHQAREATKGKKENGDVQTDEYQNEGVSGNAWSFKDPVTLYT
jgi:hypothetical protein